MLKISWSYVQAIIYRHRQARSTYIETYRLRHPKQESPPMKIIKPLRTAEL